MKNLFLIVVFITTSFMVNATEIKWYTNLDEAAGIARQQNKPLMLFFTGSDWCGWCKKLQAEVFTKPEFKDWANKSVVAVEVDFPRRTPQPEAVKAQNNKLAGMFDVPGYPTVFFVKPTLNEKRELNLAPLGNQGYLPGGPEAWIKGAEAFVPKQDATATTTTTVKKAAVKKRITRKRKKRTAR